MPRGDTPKSIAYSDRSSKPEIPNERFDNASQVRELCQQMIRADRTRSWMRDRVDALVNGWPTYPKSVTAAKGFGWFPRVNYRESEGLIAAQQTPLYDLLTEVDHCIELDLDVDGASNYEKEDWQNTIQQNFTWLMFKKWRRSFNFHLNLSNREMLVHGLGAHVWPNDNWEGRTPRSGQILFPEGVTIDFDRDGEYFMLRDFVPGVDVYQFIRNEESATKRGWFPDNVWKTLANATKQNQNIQTQDLGELQRKVRRGDLGYWGTSQVGLWLNWVFVKEFEGGISLYCIEENITAGTKDKGYLFKKRFLFEEWPLTLFPYDIGNGDLHSIVGLGWRTRDFFELSNRINNAMAVQILISALPQVKQTQPNIDPDKLKLARMGALSIIPYGLEASLQQFPPLNNSGLALQRHLKDTMEGNNQSVVGGQAPDPKDRETKFSYMLRSHDSARVSNGMQSLYESNLQDFYEKTYRRLVTARNGSLPYQKMATEFKERCRKKGVPEAALKETGIGEIRQVTSTGAGSAAIRLQAIQLLLQSPVYANASDAKKITIERDLVAATTGGASVERYARSIKDAEPADIDQSFAAQENNGLAQGGDAVVGDGQNDMMHADSHLAKAQEIMDAVEQGQMQPEQALNALEKLLQHAGQHLAKMGGNEKDPQFKKLADQWREVAKFVNQLRDQVENQQGQPSPEQQLSEQGMLAIRKDEMDNQRKTRKDDMEMQRRFRKDAFSERLSDAKTAAQIRRQG